MRGKGILVGTAVLLLIALVALLCIYFLQGSAEALEGTLI